MIYKLVEYWPSQTRLVRFPRRKSKVRHFKAFSDSLLDTPDDVLSYGGDVTLGYPSCPLLSEPWEGPDGQADESTEPVYCVELDVHQDGQNVFLFLVEAMYSTEGVDTPPNPLDRVAEVDWSTVRQTRSVIQDIHGVPITNSSRDYFDPALEIEEDIDVLTFTRFEAIDDPQVRSRFRGSVNDGPFLGYAAGQVKVQSIRSRDHWEYGTLYKHKTYEFHFKVPSSGGEPDPGFDLADYSPWDYFVLDQGSRTFDKPSNKYQNIYDRFGTAITSPTLLNGGGKELRNAFSYLNGAIAFNDLVIEVADLDGFPKQDSNTPMTIGDPDNSICPFWVRVDVGTNTELMQVTEMLTGPDRLVVTRGQRGTMAIDHGDSKLVKMEPYYFTFKTRLRLPFGEIAPKLGGGFVPIVLPT